MDRTAAGVSASAGALAALLGGTHMPIWNRQLWRTANRLHAAYAAAPQSGNDVVLPDREWRELQGLAERLSVSVGRGWTTAANEIREALATNLERLGYRLRELSVRAQTARRTIPPTTQMLYEELQATVIEFDGLEIDDKVLSVTTEPIVLDGIRLGPFAIHLDTAQLGCDSPYSITALEPNPAESSSETTHPHVHGERLCPGEGRSAIFAALSEGRLLDFFTVVDRILHTYCVGSAFVELHQWHGRPCYDCNATVDEDDTFLCHRCGQTICIDCLQGCDECGTGFCSGCMECCPRCDVRCCSDCSKSCIRCRRAVCGSCLEENVCISCLEELEHAEQQNEETSETNATPAKPAV
jgi:hypothetical protein